MSTRETIKHRDHADGEVGYELYEDVFERLWAEKSSRQVYLKLENVHVDLVSLNSGGVSVSIALPYKIAEELGLLTPNEPSSPAAKQSGGA